MSDDPSLPTADAEEASEARALRDALEGRRASPGLPEAALETAALLRAGKPAGQLSAARQAALRAELLAALAEGAGAASGRPASGPRAATERSWRARLGRWFTLGLPLLGGAAAALALALFGARTRSEPKLGPQADARSAAARQPAATVSAPTGAGEPGPAALGAAPGKGEAALPADRIEGQSRRLRGELLARLEDPRLRDAHAALDRARSEADLQSARERLKELASVELGAEDGVADAELVRQDLYCRLAEVELRLGQARAALDWAQRGLELTDAPSTFLARLHWLAGQARDELGDPPGAARSYLRALEVTETLLDESLDPP